MPTAPQPPTKPPATHPKRNCRCGHCRKTGLTRAEIKKITSFGEWLCADCNNDRGVRGSDAFLASTQEYFRNNPLPIVGGDEPSNSQPPPAAPSTPAPVDPTMPKRRTRAPTAWETYQATVLARSDLTFADKLTFVELLRHADHTTGANCAPALVDVGARYGRTARWASRCVHHLKARGLLEVIPLRSRSGWAQNLYRFVGHGYDGPVDHRKLSWLTASPSPRAWQGNDTATGRFNRVRK